MVLAASTNAGILAQIQSEKHLEFEAMPGGWLAVAALAVVGGIAWAIITMYRREARAGASPRRRAVMATARCLVIATLLSIWLEPVWATYLTRWVESYTLVLVDDSASMDLADHYADADQADRFSKIAQPSSNGAIRRAGLVHHALADADGRFLTELTRRNAVKLFTFSESAQLVTTWPANRDGQSPRPPSPEIEDVPAANGIASKGSAALRQAVRQVDGLPISGVVLITDGSFTDTEAVDSIIALANEHEIALHLVGVGDASPPRNLRILQLEAPENVFEKDPFEIVAHLSAEGMVGDTVEVQLFEGSADSALPDSPVTSQTISIGDDGTLPSVSFTRQSESVGRITYRVAVPATGFEIVTDDNSKQAVVSVIDSAVRVLLIAGSPSWEYRYLSRLLQRDQSVDLSCWLQSADERAVRDGNTTIDHLPTSAEELFSYDAVLLLDPDPAELTRDWCEQLARLVSEYGGGVLYAAARAHTPELVHDDRFRAMLTLLPVRLDPEADLILNRIGHYQAAPSEMLLPEKAYSHPALRLDENPAANRDSWRGVGGIYWHYPVLREKPGATVLMRHGNPSMVNANGQHVLAATQFVGAGRSAFLAFDGTWRWRQFGERIFDQFWIQMVRHLVEGKLLGSNKRGLILIDGDSFQLGQAVPVSARVYNEQYEPSTVDRITLSHNCKGQKQEFELKAAPDRLGWFEGSVVAKRTGDFEILLRLDAPGEAEPIIVRRQIHVERPNIEMRDPRMQRDALMTIAAAVPGSAYYEIDELERIAQTIPDLHEATTVRTRPAPAWDSAWMLLLLVGLLSFEWTLRKWSSLL